LQELIAMLLELGYTFFLVYICFVPSASLLTNAELDMLNKHDPLLLNIGGISPALGWVNVNVQYDNVLHEMEYTDVLLRNMSDLHGIPDGSVSMLYSSHTLEHVSIATGDVFRTLQEWRRVSRYGGLVMVAVPDLVMLARLYAEESYPPHVHDGIVPILYGGQRDQHDFHVVSVSVSVSVLWCLK
jgi:predicted SAM-dependent methyltransferase